MAKRFSDVAVVQEHILRAAEWLARSEYNAFLEMAESYLDGSDHWRFSLESPLEALFWVWWKAAVKTHDHFYLETQREVETGGMRYRLDFVVDVTGEVQELIEQGEMHWPKLGIELDGHSFHEKTREQVAYRNQRDRLLQEAGWTIFHFSWTEMMERPEQCAVEVVLAARKRYWEMLRTSRKAAEGSAANKAEATTSQES